MRKQLKKILRRTERISLELDALKNELDDILKTLERKERKSKPKKPQEVKIPEEELKQHYERLRTDFENRGDDAVREFVEKNKKSFLREFLRANNLPINIKLSKKEIGQELARQLRMGNLISKREFSSTEEGKQQ